MNLKLDLYRWALCVGFELQGLYKVYEGITRIVENQMKNYMNKKMENDMETTI